LNNKIKALFVAANPEQTNKLKLDEEIREINQKIRSSEYRDSLDFTSIWAVRPDDLIQYLNQCQPQIVHFSGHGSTSGEIILVDDQGQPKPVPPEAIQALFRTLKDNIQIVVLNACCTEPLAESVADIVGCAIGMNTAIGDKAAIVFAASFYRAVGFGRSIQEAFDQGKLALLMEGISEDKTPKLFTQKYTDASKLYLLTLTDDDASLLQQHMTIFDRPAFRRACAEELSFEELIEAVDDSQAAINTGKLYSRSGKLLTSFPTKNDYIGKEFRDTFRSVATQLEMLKRELVGVQRLVRQIRPDHPYPLVPWGYRDIGQSMSPGQEDMILYGMDKIDDSRNGILTVLNELLLKHNLEPFPLIERSSNLMRN
jgi:hypothetical protein